MTIETSKTKFLNRVKEEDHETFSRYYNAAMVEFGDFDNKIWTVETLIEDIKEDMFNPEWNVTLHLIEDDYSKDNDFIGENGNGFYDLSYEEALANLVDILDNNDDDKIEEVFDWIF